MTTIKAIIRNGRIETAEPLDLPEGMELFIACPGRAPDDGDGPMSADEIARIHAAMQTLLPLDIPDEVMADLDAWERKLNEHSMA